MIGRGDGVEEFKKKREGEKETETVRDTER
jgi:hypothetical protein